MNLDTSFGPTYGISAAGLHVKDANTHLFLTQQMTFLEGRTWVFRVWWLIEPSHLCECRQFYEARLMRNSPNQRSAEHWFVRILEVARMHFDQAVTMPCRFSRNQLASIASLEHAAKQWSGLLQVWQRCCDLNRAKSVFSKSPR